MQGLRLLKLIAPRVLFVAALLCAAMAVAPRAQDAEAAPAGSFLMSPSNIYLDIGQAIAVTVVINGGQNVNEVHFALQYDATVVQVLDAHASQPGTQLLQGPFPDGSSPGTHLQNNVSGGLITYQYVLSNGQMDTGSGTVATIQFQAIGNGSANFQWQTTQLVDADGLPFSAPGGVASLVVGVDTPTPTSSPVPTDTPAATATPVVSATETPTPVPSGTPSLATFTFTPSASATVTATRTATATGVAGTPTASATPKITVIQDSNEPPRSGVDPSQADRAEGLPSAGNEGPGIAWWRWVFFVGALMFGIAGWFFTLAVYNNSKEVVIVDRFDRRRRRR